MNYKCSKCGEKESETGEIRTTGSGLSRFLNLQNNKFGYIACKQCGFCDFYRLNSNGKFLNVLDILSG